MTADTTPPGTGIVSGPANGARSARRRSPTPRSSSSAPTTRRPILELEFECSLDTRAVGAVRVAGRRSAASLPGEHTFRVRAVDLARQRRPDAGDPHLDGRRRRRSRRSPPGRGHAQRRGRCRRRARAETRDLRLRRRPARLDLRVLARRGRRPAATRRSRPAPRRSPTAASRTATHEFEVRATNPRGRRRGAAGALRVDRRARARHRSRRRHAITARAARASTSLTRRDLRVHRHRQPRRATLDLRVRARRDGLQLLHLARAVLRPDPRHALAAASAPATPPATSTRRPRATRGPSRRRRSRRSSPARTRSPRARPRRSPSSPTCPARPSGAGSTACSTRTARSPKTYTDLAHGRALLRRPRPRPARHLARSSGWSTSGRSAT